MVAGCHSPNGGTLAGKLSICGHLEGTAAVKSLELTYVPATCLQAPALLRRTASSCKV